MDGYSIEKIYGILNHIGNIKRYYSMLITKIPFLNIAYTPIKSLNVCATSIIINQSIVCTFNPTQKTIHLINTGKQRFSLSVDETVITILTRLASAIRGYNYAMMLITPD